MSIWHRLQHLLRWTSCVEETEWRQGVLWYVVRCRTCQRVVNQWASSIRTSDVWR